MTLPPPDAPREPVDPFSGEPRATPPRAWTRAPEPEWKRKRNSARTAAIISVAVAGFLALAGIASAAVMNAIRAAQYHPVTYPERTARAPAPAPSATTHAAWEMVFPDGWPSRTSTRGSAPVAFAYDPSWTEVTDAPENVRFQEDADAAAADDPANAVLLLGEWERAASATLPAVTIRVVEDPLAGRRGSLEEITEQFAIDLQASAGDDDPEIFYSGDWVHPLGYAGWRTTFFSGVDDGGVTVDVTAVEYGDAVVFSAMTTDGYPVPIEPVPASVVFLPRT